MSTQSIPQSEENVSETVHAALALAEKGFAVFPLHAPLFAEDGTVRCTCGKDDCTSIGKHPRTGNGGHLNASTEAGKITRLFDNPTYPAVNIGVSLIPSGLLIVGPDSESWHETFKARGLPDTYTVKSGNGWHYYYRLPDG